MVPMSETQTMGLGLIIDQKKKKKSSEKETHNFRLPVFHLLEVELSWKLIF